MDRFFGKVSNGHAFLSEEDTHHLLDVLRYKEGETFEVVSDGHLFDAKLVSRNPLVIDATPSSKPSSELKSHLILAFSLLKGGHDELVIQKGTELGVYAYMPFISDRCIIKLDEKEKKKRLERFKKIAYGAACQSKRMIIPEVLGIFSFKDIMNMEADKRLFAYEDVAYEGESLANSLKDLKEEGSALLVVGPEGGFSTQEAKLAAEKGFEFVSLGKRILRAETASIFGASVFASLEEKK